MWDLIVSVPDHCLSFYFGSSWVPVALYQVSRPWPFGSEEGMFEGFYRIWA